MTKSLKLTFLVHAIVSLVLGAVLLIIPGRFLEALGWAPIDPIISRILGAALLALAFGSYRGWQARERAQVIVLVQMEAIFTLLACAGLLRHLLLPGRWPVVPWLAFAVFALFAIAWLYALVKR